jgi:hypothetical protein
MTPNEPGERPRLRQAPSARYRAADGGTDGGTDDGTDDVTDGARAPDSALRGPLTRAIAAAILGAAALVLVGAVFASTFGLTFVGGAMGAAIGLLLARASAPDRGTGLPVARSRVSRLAMGLALVAVAVADVAIWLYGRGEGGTLGLFDYLWTAFGPFVPGVAFVALVGAAWGASAGPVQR